MSRQKCSPQALKLCGATLVCLVIMFGVAGVNKARGGERLVQEYTVTEGSPRHVKFENMPTDEAQLEAAWFFKYNGLAQFDRCSRLFPGDQAPGLDLDQSEQDFKNGEYIKEYRIHSFETLPAVEYADQKPYYDQKAQSCGYKEYKVVRVHFSQKWSDKGLEKVPKWGNGQYVRDFAVGKKNGFGNKWKIFNVGMM